MPPRMGRAICRVAFWGRERTVSVVGVGVGDEVGEEALFVDEVELGWGEAVR